MTSNWFFIFVLFGASHTLATVYEGTLYDSDGILLAEPGVQLKAQVFDESQICIMFERTFTLDLSASNGQFSIDLAAGGTPPAGPHSSNNLDDVLSNAASNSVTCSSGLVVNFDGSMKSRYVRVVLEEIDSVDIEDVALPFQALKSVPFAVEAMSSVQIQGVKVDSTAPAHGQVLRYDQLADRYIPNDVLATAIDWTSITNIPADIADGDAVGAANSDGIIEGSTNLFMSTGEQSKLSGIEVNAKDDQTPAEILSALITVDGAGTAVDADLLDGQHGAYYLDYDNLSNQPDLSTLSGDADDISDGSSKVLMTTAERLKLGTLNRNSLDASDGTPVQSVFVDADGLVGVGGVTSPAYNLDISGDVRATGDMYAGSYYYTSDRRLKKDIKDIEGLEAILKLHGVQFSWRKNGEGDIGLIAQDVEKVLPDLVTVDPFSGFKTVKYGNLVAPLIESVKELNEGIQSNRQRIDQMQKQIDMLIEENRKLRKLLEK